MTEIITGILTLISALIIFVASVGIVRFNNLYARMHVVTKVSSFAMMLILIGVNVFFMSLRVLMISIIVFHVVVFLSPVAAHVIAKVSTMINPDDED